MTVIPVIVTDTDTDTGNYFIDTDFREIVKKKHGSFTSAVQKSNWNIQCPRSELEGTEEG